MFDSKSCECVCENQKRGAAAAVVIRKLSCFFHPSPFFSLFFLCICIFIVCTRTWVPFIHVYVTRACVCMLMHRVRVIVESDVIDRACTIRNNISRLLFCITFLFPRSSSISRQCFGTFWSWLTVRAIYPCIPYIIYILYCIRYNTCIIYSASISCRNQQFVARQS